jgi:hypothetical protein
MPNKPNSRRKPRRGQDTTAAAGKDSQENASRLDSPRTIKSTEIVEEICRRLANGEPLTHICRDEHMPEPRTVRLWQLEDEQVAARIARARDIGFDAIAEECLTISDDKEEDPQSRRVMVETRLKLLAKWCHRRYGDKVELEHSGKIDSNVTVLDETRRKDLIERRRRAIEFGKS